MVDSDALEYIFQLLIEESDRRSLDQRSFTVLNSEICTKYLYPNLEEDIQEILKTQSEHANNNSGKKRDDKEEAKQEDADVGMKVDSIPELKSL